MFRTNPLATRLATQFAPAAIVTVIGVALLSNLARPAGPAPTAAPVEAAIAGDAIFKATPRQPEVADEQNGKAAAARTAVKPKPVAAAPQPRKPVNEPRQVASLPPPLPIVQVQEQPQPTPVSDNTVMGKLRSATATVTRIPQWAGQSVAGWFSAAPTPRPPAPVPGQNFQAVM